MFANYSPMPDESRVLTICPQPEDRVSRTRYCCATASGSTKR